MLNFGSISIFIFSKIRTDTAEIVDIEIRIGIGFEIEIRLVLILTRFRLNSLLEDTFRLRLLQIGIDPVSYTHLTLPTTPYV